jgi:glycosyltransferase involved in cell wall biosynthesis
MARLCKGLRDEGIDARLGSVRYHLDRKYFAKQLLETDPWLLDFGGGISNSFFRRIVKLVEYAINLLVLSVRFAIANPRVLHVQFLPLLERGWALEVWFLQWIKRLGIPVVYTVHNTTPQDNPGRYLPLYKRVYAIADALICHGEKARADIVKSFGVPREKTRVISHGPLFDELPSVSPEEAKTKLGFPLEMPVVLSLGVISEYKGIPFLLDAWKAAVDAGMKAKLIVAGTGDAELLSGIRAKVSTERLEGSVELMLQFIHVELLPVLYQAADVLVYPYKAGTTSGALLTGMNYNKAMVTTTLPFFCELLTHERDALLIGYGDVEGWAHTLRTLAEDSGLRTRLAHNVQQSKALVSSWDGIARATGECYLSVMAEKR